MIEPIIDTFLRGGVVMFPIAVLSFVLWFLIIERIMFFKNESSLLDYRLHQALEEFFQGKVDKLKTFCHRASGIAIVLLKKTMLSKRNTQVLEKIVNEMSLVEFPKFNRHLTTISILTIIAPLLGLLGTVCGMIQTFDVLTIHGTGDPHALSRGISQALISTQAGLIVALPGLLMHMRLETKAQRMTRELEKILIQIKRWAKMKGNYDSDKA